MTETGLFTFATNNLGDEMQSLAVLAHVDRVHRFLDRDRLASCDAGNSGSPGNPAVDIACVFNSWFMLGNDVRIPSKRIRPIWHGFCGGREEMFEEPWLSYLKSQEPIGCRDRVTTERLLRAGISAEWSGCLTLFLGRALRRPAAERRGVVFVDVPSEAERFIPPDITRRAVRLSTFPAPGTLDKTLERWATVGRLVDACAQAELVVTRRLHVALPAASLGTPVVAIVDPAISLARQRFSGFDAIVPTVYLDAAEAGLKAIDWRNVPAAQVPDALEARYSAFRALLSKQGMAATTYSSHVLDEVGPATQRLANVAQLLRPGRLRLRLADRVFELDVQLWSDRFVDVALSGFPGLSKFDFQVECCAADAQEWMAWGPLRDLVSSAEPCAGAFAA